MKKILSMAAMAAAALITGCRDNQEQRVNDFIKGHSKPIFVKASTAQYTSGKRDVTLISKDGTVLFIEWSTIALPDTIK